MDSTRGQGASIVVIEDNKGMAYFDVKTARVLEGILILILQCRSAQLEAIET